MKITNNSQQPQGVHGIDRLIFIQPGETKEVDLSESGLKQARELSFLNIEGGKASKPATPVTINDVVKMPADLLAMFADTSIPFMTSKSEAAKLLGDAMPAKKVEIIAALEALAKANAFKAIGNED